LPAAFLLTYDLKEIAMGLLKFLSFERRTALVNGDPWLVQLLSRGTQTASGTWVTPETSLRIAAVFACVRVISTGIATLPLILYRRLAAGGKERAPENPLFATLHDAPNDWQTSFEFWEMLLGHLLLQGNAYAEIFYRSDGSIDQLVPLNPQRTMPFRGRDGNVWYQFRPLQGADRTIAADEMFHIRGFSNDGLTGLAPIALMREALGLAMSAEEFQARFFSNDATPPIALKHPKALTDEAAKRLKQSWQESHSGLPNAHKIAVLEEGLDVATIGISNRDAQFLELRKYQVTEIARIFGVPPHLVADLERATFSNIEQQAIEFVRYCLGPWMRRIEQAIAMRLMTAKMRNVYFAEFYADRLLRGDMQARSVFYHEAILDGWMNRNEVRDRENMNRAEGLDEFLIPLNEETVGAEKEPPAPASPKPSAVDPSDDSERASRLAGELRRLNQERAARLVRKEVAAIRRIAKKHHPRKAIREFVDQVEEFYRDFEGGTEHASESRRQIRSAIADAPADDGIDAIEALMARWEASRAGEIADQEMRRLV
jgi:HK97 family phage portal protein